jgi:hypothetical protein
LAIAGELFAMTLIQNPTLRQSFTLLVDERKVIFDRLPLVLEASGLTDLFAQRNNKTLGEVIAYRRYAELAEPVHRQYPGALHEPLGAFLLRCKRAGDPIYRRFLHAYGDGVYARFSIPLGTLAAQQGVYCFCVAGQIVYIGRSRTPFVERINQTYGAIHAKDCYLGGPVARCRLNSLIAAAGAAAACFVFPLGEARAMAYWERRLISLLHPAWNVRAHR